MFVYNWSSVGIYDSSTKFSLFSTDWVAKNGNIFLEKKLQSDHIQDNEATQKMTKGQFWKKRMPELNRKRIQNPKMKEKCIRNQNS